MSTAMIVLSAGAALGVGAVAVPIAGGALSKPITGEDVPARITDLLGYLTASKERGLTEEFVGEDDFLEQSIGPPAATVGTAPPKTPVTPRPAPPLPSKATSENKRMLAAAALGVGLLVSGVSFSLIRRVLP